MRFVIFILLVVSLFSVTDSQAQSRRKKKKEEKEKAYTTDISSVKSASHHESDFLSSEMHFSKKKFSTAAEGIERAENLREANIKKYRKMSKEMASNPRYYDPSYFGHKHKPKKHRPGKKKFCKECGIAH